MNTQQNNYAATNRHKVKMVALCAMLLAIGAILDSYLKIPLLGDALQLKFAFIAFAIAGMLYGPWVGLWFGLALDTLSCIFQGGFSLGWSWEFAMIQVIKGFLFGLILYNAKFSSDPKSKVAWWRIILAKCVDTIFVNIFLNSFLIYFVLKYVPFNWPHFATRIGKNLALLPIEILILFFAIRFCEKNRKLLK